MHRINLFLIFGIVSPQPLILWHRFKIQTLKFQGVALIFECNHNTMKPLSFDEGEKLFKEAISESDTYFKLKEYEKAFRSLAKANLLLGTYLGHSSDVYERGHYIQNLIKIKDRQGEICIKEKNPKYDYYLIHYLESFALDIANDLISFPHISGFYHRKKIQSLPYSEDFGSDSLEISLDEDTDVFVSLKKLKIFQWRKDILKEYLDFVYNELPIIYGISPKYNQESIKRIFDARDLNSEDWNDIVFIFPQKLNNQSITILTFEINRFVTNLLKKYYDMENP